MKFDFTITLSVVIIFVTAISPIIVTILNNKHQIEMKKLDNKLSIRNKIIDDFIDITLDCKNEFYKISEFYKALNRVLPYSTDKFSTRDLENIKGLIEDKPEGYYEQINRDLMSFIERVNNSKPTKTNKSKSIMHKLSKLLKK